MIQQEPELPFRTNTDDPWKSYQARRFPIRDPHDHGVCHCRNRVQYLSALLRNTCTHLPLLFAHAGHLVAGGLNLQHIAPSRSRASRRLHGDWIFSKLHDIAVGKVSGSKQGQPEE